MGAPFYIEGDVGRIVFVMPEKVAYKYCLDRMEKDSGKKAKKIEADGYDFRVYTGSFKGQKITVAPTIGGQLTERTLLDCYAQGSRIFHKMGTAGSEVFGSGKMCIVYRSLICDQLSMSYCPNGFADADSRLLRELMEKSKKMGIELHKTDSHSVWQSRSTPYVLRDPLEEKAKRNPEPIVIKEQEIGTIFSIAKHLDTLRDHVRSSAIAVVGSPIKRHNKNRYQDVIKSLKLGVDLSLEYFSSLPL